VSGFRIAATRDKVLEGMINALGVDQSFTASRQPHNLLASLQKDEQLSCACESLVVEAQDVYDGKTFHDELSELLLLMGVDGPSKLYSFIGRFFGSAGQKRRKGDGIQNTASVGVFGCRFRPSRI
jgi:hypothetical protein